MRLDTVNGSNEPIRSASHRLVLVFVLFRQASFRIVFTLWIKYRALPILFHALGIAIGVYIVHVSLLRRANGVHAFGASHGPGHQRGTGFDLPRQEPWIYDGRKCSIFVRSRHREPRE